jgi:hypothetical protein
MIKGEGRIALKDIDSMCDVQVEAKPGAVMIFANPKGREIVEDLWPDVEWRTDEKFSSCHPAEWLFTHIRVTRIPPHFEKLVPLNFATPESLGYAVALAVARRAGPKRVVWWKGEAPDLEIIIMGDVRNEPSDDIAVFAEYVPPTPVGVAGNA